MRSKYSINFLKNEPKTQQTTIWLKLGSSLMILSYGILACLWWGLSWYQADLRNRANQTRNNTATELMTQKRRLLTTLKQWDDQYQQQIHTLRLIKWLLNNQLVRALHYEDGFISINGITHSQQRVDHLKNHLKHHFNLSSLTLQQLTDNPQGGWQFRLGGSIDD